MKILAVAELYPWPAVDGYRQRFDHLVRALQRVGDVDVFALVRGDLSVEPAPCPVPGIGRVVTAPAAQRPMAAGLADWVREQSPRRPLMVDWSAARDALTDWGPTPDLVWFSHIDSWLPLRDLFGDTPTIVDFDNLENLSIKLRRRQPPRVSPGAGPLDRARAGSRWVASRGLDLVDERRWEQIQRACAAAVDSVVVCSSLDAKRSGCPNAVVIPNGADQPEGVEVDRTALRGDAPAMLFVGAIDYEPNTEAVEWFVREVLPLVRARCPEAVVRIVGRGTDRVAWVADVPGVELVGEVEAIRPELDRADVSLVPIRAGAGTRLKVVEAMAHHIPIVTTPVGCEGIDLVPGHHALITDDPRRFADACLRLLADGSLRQQLADAAAELYEQRYTWDAIGDRLVEAVEAVVAAGGPGQSWGRTTAGE